MTKFSNVKKFLVILAVLVGALAIKSLFMPVEHDAPLLLYPAKMVLSGERLPYKQIFDFNWPGSYLVYGVLWFGSFGSETFMRIYDVLLFVLLGWLAIRRMPESFKVGAIAGHCAFGCLYFSQVWFYGLQREYFILIFSIAALGFSEGAKKLGPLWAGLLTSLACSIKPHALLGNIWVNRASLKKPLWYVGFAVPVVLFLGYLIAKNCLGDFIDIQKNYTPLYGHMNGEHTVVQGLAAYSGRLIGLLMTDNNWPIAIVGALLTFVWLRNKENAGEERKIVLDYAGLLVGFWLYPAVAGQYWSYHYLPFYFALFILLGIQLGQLKLNSVRQWAAAVSLIIIAAPGVVKVFAPIEPAKQGRVDKIADFLKNHRNAGETVQPLDWTEGGVIHAMLKANAPIATKFIYDFHFYHDINNPYILKIRQEFLDEFNAAKPRFVVYVAFKEKPWPEGPDTTYHWKELEALLARDYKVVDFQKDVYYIFERNPGS